MISLLRGLWTMLNFYGLWLMDALTGYPYWRQTNDGYMVLDPCLSTRGTTPRRADSGLYLNLVTPNKYVMIRGDGKAPSPHWTVFTRDTTTIKNIEKIQRTKILLILYYSSYCTCDIYGLLNRKDIIWGYFLSLQYDNKLYFLFKPLVLHCWEFEPRPEHSCLVSGRLVAFPLWVSLT